MTEEDNYYQDYASQLIYRRAKSVVDKMKIQDEKEYNDEIRKTIINISIHG